MGVDLHKLPLRYGAFGAEPWSEAMRRDIEARFDIKAMDTYGLSEIIGPGVASECHQAQSGLHIWEDHFLCEVIDPDTAQVLPPACGSLLPAHRGAADDPLPPRDITRLSDSRACGRTHRRMLRVTGRSDDMLIIRGVNVYPCRSRLTRGFSAWRHYQIVLTREGPMDAMTVESSSPPLRPTSCSSAGWRRRCATTSRRWWA